MNFEIIITQRFKRELKRLVKKFPSLKVEFESLIDLLEVDPIQGTPIGNGFYKIRLAISSKGKGKSGGARVISYAVITNETLYLIAVYDKSEQQNISQKELQDFLSSI
ncbi:MAG: hypothetical protein EOP42_29330 [Sphingobacteriaceae bacterium]|nr:MAG: hypothetical protein EOP42_29330 [Sphingobacteriaceae bacterium]